MEKTKADIVAQLRKDLLLLGGLKEPRPDHVIDIGLGAIKKAFPGNAFPLGAVHELVADSMETMVASRGFMAAIIGRLMKLGGVLLWIGPTKVFPPALLAFGIPPSQVVFIDLHRDRDVLWVMEEGLKSTGLVAVIAEARELTLNASRRLQLAVEQSGVTGFILRCGPVGKNQTACVARWRISSLSSGLEPGMPGVGFPRWKVKLEKVRNGKPGVWNMEWKAGRFRLLTETTIVAPSATKNRVA
jgi:protein ImuA